MRGLLASARVTSVVLGAASCVDPPSADELIAQQIVVTKFDPAVDFASFTTFAIVDTIPVYAAFDAGAPSRTVDASLAGPMLDAISSQLTARGYRRVGRGQAPDLGVNVEALVKIKTATLTPYGEWLGVGSAGAGYWGFQGGLILAPFEYQTVAWSSGTLIIELYDLHDAAMPSTSSTTRAAPSPTDAQGPIIDVAWGALIHGVVGELGAPPLTAPPLDAIEQCFAQSQYLRK